jgi:LPS export ABC transporter permease LptG
MSFLRRHSSLILLLLALAAMGAGFCAWLVPAESRAVTQQLIGFPDSDVHAHQARPMVLAALCFLPSFACLIYSFGGTLDRYITRQFLVIFGICLTGLFLIFLLIDLSDKISDFLGTKHVLRTIGRFYATRFPAILLLLLPYSLLLAVLHALGKFSTNREIIAMIQSGRGVVRITLPLLIAGIFCTLLSLGLNYHWAPIAEGHLNEILAEASDKPATKATQVLYRNPENRRLWMIGAFPKNYHKDQPLLNVEVTTTDANHMLQSRISAARALWNRHTRQWTFDKPAVSHYRPGRPPDFDPPVDSLTIDSWSETPWLLIKPGISAEYLGVPDLSGWLQTHSRLRTFADPSPYLTQWHYRWALPFTCLVTVLLATPLAIHFSRRGAGGGVFLAVVLSALMLLVSNIVLAFGESGTLRPALAAWLPNILFGLLGLYLFRRRITGRPIYHSLRRLFPGEE